MPAWAETKRTIRSFRTGSALEAHLAARKADDAGFWLKLAKAGAPSPTLTKAEAIEAALCHGWIDGQLDKHDAHYFLVRMTPRRRGSRWSDNNRKTAERLIREGRMQSGGLAQVEAAKADGRWAAAYRPASTAEPPADLVEALAATPGAQRAFATLDAANRYAIIYRVNDAKRPETRQRRIAQYVDMLARGETLHPAKRARAQRN